MPRLCSAGALRPPSAALLLATLAAAAVALEVPASSAGPEGCSGDEGCRADATLEESDASLLLQTHRDMATARSRSTSASAGKVAKKHQVPAAVPAAAAGAAVDPGGGAEAKKNPDVHPHPNFKLSTKPENLPYAGLMEMSSEPKQANHPRQNMIFLAVSTLAGTPGTAAFAWLVSLLALLVVMVAVMWAQSSDRGPAANEQLGRGKPGAASGYSSGVDTFAARRTPPPSFLSTAQFAGSTYARSAPTSYPGTARNEPPTAGSAGGVSAYEVDVSGGPPAICPSLILPNTEARFMIPMDLLQMAAGMHSTFDVLGTSGRKLLHAAVADREGRRSLMLCSVGCEDDPRCTIAAPLPGGGPSAAMAVFGRHGRPYGSLEASGGGRCVLMCGGHAVMLLEVSSPTELRMRASTVSGRDLATAGPVSAAPGARHGEAHDREHWKLQVQPGADAVLIASCMLALHLLPMQDSGLPSVHNLASPRSPWPSTRGRLSVPPGPGGAL